MPSYTHAEFLRLTTAAAGLLPWWTSAAGAQAPAPIRGIYGWER